MPEKMGRVRAFALIDRELSMEKGERTPSFKVVRTKVVENFSTLTNAVYDPSGADTGVAGGIIYLDNENK